MTTKTPEQQAIKKPVWPYPDKYIDINGRRYYARMTAHRNGQWVKKIPHTNKLWYGGSIKDPDLALKRWRVEWPSLVTGKKPDRDPTPSPDAITLFQLFNYWGEAKGSMVEAGEMVQETLKKYRWIGSMFCKSVGPYRPVISLTARDFTKFRSSINKYKITGRTDIISVIKSAFNWGVENGLIEHAPRYGAEFKRPTRTMHRKARHMMGNRTVPASDIRYMLVNADVHLKAVIYLGINTGMKTLDIATLGPPMLDLERGVIDGVRRKRWTPMYAPLWPETIKAIRAAACETGPLLQWQGRLPWNGHGTDRIGREFKTFRERLGLPAYTHGRLRHTLRTIGGEADYRGVRRVMGHLSGDVLDEIYDSGKLMAATQRAVDAVRWWLFTDV